MIRVALTGSIAMGKSATARMFGELGIPVFDADAAVHALYAPGGAAVEPVGRRFPGAVADGRVARDRLAAQVLGRPEALAALEAIVHPLVRDMQEDFLDKARSGGHDMVLFDIPLLFETGREDEFDAVVVVSAPAEAQRARALERPGMTADKLDAILARQVPDGHKRNQADYVVDTSQGFEAARRQVRDIVATLRGRADQSDA